MVSLILFLTMANAATYTKQDVNSAICWTLAKQKGYEMGSYDATNNRCLYVDSEDFKEATKEVLTLPRNFRGGLPKSDTLRLPNYLLERE
jgi:hypothetical protein